MRPPPVKAERFTRLLVAANLIAGALSLLLQFTDWSLAGTIPDLVWPLVLVVLSLVAIRIASRQGERRLARLSVLPLLASGIPVLGVSALLLLNPLGAMFLYGELESEVELQRIRSPDGSKTAVVTFRPVGAYAGGNGRISVRVRYRWAPFLERDVHFKARSYAERDSTDYAHWQSNRLLSLAESPRLIEIDPIGFEVPFYVRGLVSLWRSLRE